MMYITVRVRELVSSNVDSMVDKASNPRKMLKLLLTEVEESLIGLHGDRTKTSREHDREIALAEKLGAAAESWTAKAKTAVDHKREDLARAALLARESERSKAEEARAHAENLKAKLDEVETAISDLEAKREDVLGRLKTMPEENSGARGRGRDSTTAKRMDRIDEMERRVNFGSEGVEPSTDAIDAEIAELETNSAIDAELDAMKTPPAKKGGRKKAK